MRKEDHREGNYVLKEVTGLWPISKHCPSILLMVIETGRLTQLFKTQFFYSLDMQLDNKEMCNIHSTYFLTR